MINNTETTSEVKEVKQRIKRAETYSKDWHNAIDKWRGLYNMQHYSGTPKPKEIQYADPTFTNTVDLAVGIMLGNDLRWHSYGFEPSNEEQNNTGMIEKLIAGTIEINNERTEKHQMYELFLNFDRDAGGVLYSVYDQNIADSVHTIVEVPDSQSPTGVVQKHKFLEVPIVVKAVDPRTFICLAGGPKRWLMMGTKEKRSILEVEMEYGVKIDRFSTLDEETKSSTMGIFYNVWDWTYVDRKPYVRNTVIFEEQAVKGPEIMDHYEDLPYDVQFFKPTGDASKDWHNIMVPMESSVALLERSFNRRAYQVDVFTGLPLVIKTQPGRKVNIDSGLYNSVNISPDEEIVFPQWPGTAPDVQMQIDFLRSRIQQSGFSDVMFGSGANQIAGYAVSQLGDQNRIRLEQPIQHMELLLTLWAKKVLKLLSYFAKDSIICVYGMQRGQDYKDEVDISKISGYSIRAEIRANFPNEQARKTAMATQIKGTLSDYTIMERYLDIQQPEDENKRKIIEATIRHPVALQYAIMAELKDMADNGDEIAAMTLQSLMNQGGLPGQDGRPKDPNKPEQLTGTASPTGQPTPQASGGQPAGQSATDQQNALANQAPKLTA